METPFRRQAQFSLFDFSYKLPTEQCKTKLVYTLSLFDFALLRIIDQSFVFVNEKWLIISPH